jgi:hypothetical protein
MESNRTSDSAQKSDSDVGLNTSMNDDAARLTRNTQFLQQLSDKQSRARTPLQCAWL